MSPQGGAPLDPDRDEARRLLQAELDDGGYQLQESLVGRLLRWLGEHLPAPHLTGPLPGWLSWAVLSVVLLAVAAVLLYATRDRWRVGRLTARTAPGPVLDGPRRAASDHRAAARRALAEGDHGTAVLEAYRAITAGAVERTLLDDRPGLTAHEVAAELSHPFVTAAPELARAAADFDAVRYGHRPVTPERARAVLDLDERLAGTRPELPTDPAPGPRLAVPS